MRTMLCFTLILAVIATVAVAGDKLLYDKSKPPVSIQNLNALAPVKGKQRCDTGAFTKAQFKGYSTAGYLAADTQVVDTAGAGVNVKWFLDGVQTWVGSTFSFTNPAGSTYGKVTFQPYSGASRNLTSCTKRQ